MSAPKSPGTTRTSRNRALEIGTDPSGFSESPAWDVGAGAPVGTPGVSGTYQNNTSPAAPSPTPAQPSPFKLGK